MRKVTFRKNDRLDFKANEAFKTLRSNILFSGKGIKVLILTSATPNEGKSSVSFQLVRSFAIAGNRVLFVDADIRKSVIAGRYKIDGGAFGLTHYMTGQREMGDIIYQTDIENMDIILAGPVSPNPTELLGGSLFAKLLEVQRENYNYIIIDAPPLGSVIDAALIARYADGAIIVVESGVISYKMLQRVKNQLEKSECRILGVVLNKVDMVHDAYYGNYYGKYYGKYYGNSGES
jgi:capsular exopolysaccharide synthesis family protein